LSAAAIEAALLVTNRERCNPPLAADEVAKIAASVARYEPGAARSFARALTGHTAATNARTASAIAGVRKFVESLGAEGGVA
jgi:hypothetical protein